MEGWAPTSKYCVASTSLRALLVRDLLQPEVFTQFSPKAFFLKKNTTVLLLGKVKHRLGKISDKNSRGLGDEKRCAAFKGASWVGPVTCTLNLHDFGQLYIALINIFVKPDQIKMMFVLCMRVLVVAR